MRKDERIVDFDRQVNDPFWWEMNAHGLFTAAEALFEDYEDALEEMRQSGAGEISPVGADWILVALFLKGRGLECLLKALCAKNGMMLASKGQLKIKGHNLMVLSEKAGLGLNIRERALFKRLTDIMLWGLYPVPKSYSDWRLPVKGIKGPLLPTRVVRKSDFHYSGRVQAKIYKLLRNTEKS
jgi:hypothetical protein